MSFVVPSPTGSLNAISKSSSQVPEDLSKRVLVVEGNASETTARIVSHGGQPHADLYATLLRSLSPHVECEIIRPADAEPKARDWSKYDGAVWTGASLSAFEPTAPVIRQVDLMPRILDAKVPVFGSCWGLQVFAQAYGGEVTPMTHHETPLALDVMLNEEGAAHPMFQGKPRVFHSYSVHSDEVTRLPARAVLLASNARCQVQAAAYEHDGASFWGVQYHPEFDRRVMVSVLRRLCDHLVEEGIYPNAEAVESEASRFDSGTFEVEGLAERKSLTDARIRHIEIRNWLEHVVGARCNGTR